MGDSNPRTYVNGFADHPIQPLWQPNILHNASGLQPSVHLILCISLIYHLLFLAETPTKMKMIANRININNANPTEISVGNKTNHQLHVTTPVNFNAMNNKVSRLVKLIPLV